MVVLATFKMTVLHCMSNRQTGRKKDKQIERLYGLQFATVILFCIVLYFLLFQQHG